jgi:hypothetical protein
MFMEGRCSPCDELQRHCVELCRIYLWVYLFGGLLGLVFVCRQCQHVRRAYIRRPAHAHALVSAC